MKSILMIVLICGALICGACVSVPAPTTTAPSGIANPASENCVKQGGTVDIRKEAKGEVGYCKFADGSECEEWALFRGECAAGGAKADMPNPASANCVKQGGTVDIRKEAKGEVGYCKFADGSECEEWALFRGECAAGGAKAGAGTATPAP